jgi:hypothetical protein
VAGCPPCTILGAKATKLTISFCVIAPAMALCGNEGDNHCFVAEVDPLGVGCCYNVFADQAIQPRTDSSKLHVVTTNERVSGTVRMLRHKLGAIDESLRVCQKTRPLTHGAPPAVDKLLPGYRFFFFSCLASFFSLAVFCGFFFSAFFVSSDLDMWFPSHVQPQDFTTISSLATKYK